VDGTFWKDAINNAVTTKESAMIEILNGAQAADVTSVNNKVTVATTFTAAVKAQQITYTDSSDIASAKNILSQVTSDPATIATGQAAVEAISTPVTEPEEATSAIVGSWELNQTDPNIDMTFTFNADGSYTHWERGPQKYAGFSGTETGTYTSNDTAGIVTVGTVTSDTNGDWGLSDIEGGNTFNFNVDDNGQLRLEFPGENQAFTFSPAAGGGSTTSSIVGTWGLVITAETDPDDYITFTFNADGTYSHWETGGSSTTEGPMLVTDEDNPSGYQGTEAGTYTWDEATGTLTILEITSDSNGDWGLSDQAGGGTLQISIVGNTTFTIPMEDLTFTMV